MNCATVSWHPTSFSFAAKMHPLPSCSRCETVVDPRLSLLSPSKISPEGQSSLADTKWGFLEIRVAVLYNTPPWKEGLICGITWLLSVSSFLTGRIPRIEIVVGIVIWHSPPPGISWWHLINVVEWWSNQSRGQYIKLFPLLEGSLARSGLQMPVSYQRKFLGCQNSC